MVEWKKRNTTILKTKNLLPGTTVIEAKFVGMREREIKDIKTKQPKMVTDLLFKKGDDDFAVPRDAGLKLAFSDAQIKEGEMVKIVKLEQIDIDGGNRLNQYDVFVQ